MSAKKTPSYLKGLVEDRARAAGEVIYYEKTAQDVAESLDKARHALNALDTVIRRFDAGLSPEHIQPIAAWKTQPGARGRLKQTILEMLEQESPNSLSTVQIASAKRKRLGNSALA
jgi:hypothetical protein